MVELIIHICLNEHLHPLNFAPIGSLMEIGQLQKGTLKLQKLKNHELKCKKITRYSSKLFETIHENFSITVYSDIQT